MQIGSALGPYRILRHLGSGGMGSVWLAEDTRLHRQVALKTLRAADDDDAPARARLMREARAAAALNHPHIATVYDVLENDGQVVIVFEYVEGETLAARLARDPLPAPEAVEMGCQIAKALVVAHAHGIVHRDLKPANVIVGAGGQLKVLDFGIARLLATGTTQTSGGASASGPGFMGTPAYAAPEQMVSSAVDERADLYALGVMLFEMVSGRRPFAGSDPVALASSKLAHDAPALKSTGALIPRDLERLVGSLLARDREQRPASAADVLGHLRAIYGTPTTGVLAAEKPARTIAAVLAAAVLVAAVAGFGIWEIRRDTGPDSPASSGPPVVAVMPLDNISGDSARDFLSAGISESLIAGLAASPALTVLSRAAVVEARNRVPELTALARDLGATYLVQGGVQQSGDQLRVTLSLLKPDRSIAWASSFDGSFSRVFELQTRMSLALGEAMSVRVGDGQNVAQRRPTENPEALSEYWKGRAYLDRRDVKGNLEAAASSFSEAIRLDPKFALAHAALGETYWRQYSETREPSWVVRSTEAGMTALRLDPDRPEVRLTLAITLAGSGKQDEAVDELRKALAARPTYDDARRQLGQILARQGKIDEAVEEFDHAIALRPNFWGNYNDLGLALFNAARYQEAANAFERMASLQPDNYLGFQQLGTVYQTLGASEKAVDNYRKSIAIRPSFGAFSNLGAVYHGRGEFEQAIASYREAVALRPNSAVGYRNIGDSYTRLGRSSEAKAAYESAIAKARAELVINPSDGRNLAALAVYLAKAGQRAEAASTISKAVGLAPTDLQVIYRAAVTKTLLGLAEEGIGLLQGAVDRGYSIAAIRDDEDFKSIRSLTTFRKLVQVPEGQK